jgi:hypothetical protein
LMAAEPVFCRVDDQDDAGGGHFDIVCARLLGA